jgi:oxygen-independent coproporphyrinogen-3 oxidase
MVESGRLPVGGSETLDARDAHLEEVFLRMRVLEGIPSSWVPASQAAPYVEAGLLTAAPGRLTPTERGLLLLNEVVLGLTADPV